MILGIKKYRTGEQLHFAQAHWQILSLYLFVKASANRILCGQATESHAGECYKYVTSAFHHAFHVHKNNKNNIHGLSANFLTKLVIIITACPKSPNSVHYRIIN